MLARRDAGMAGCQDAGIPGVPLVLGWRNARMPLMAGCWGGGMLGWRGAVTAHVTWLLVLFGGVVAFRLRSLSVLLRLIFLVAGS